MVVVCCQAHKASMSHCLAPKPQHEPADYYTLTNIVENMPNTAHPLHLT